MLLIWLNVGLIVVILIFKSVVIDFGFKMLVGNLKVIKLVRVVVLFLFFDILSVKLIVNSSGNWFRIVLLLVCKKCVMMLLLVDVY